MYVCVYMSSASYYYVCVCSESQHLSMVHCNDSMASVAGTQFTCFTSTTVQILTPDELRGRPRPLVRLA